MKKVLIAFGTLAFLSLGGCAGTQPAGSAMSDVDKAIAEAEKELAAVNKTGHAWQWIDTATGRNSVPLEKLLAAAKKARDAGDTAEAMRIANRVAEVARLGQEQAKEQANAGPYYPK